MMCNANILLAYKEKQAARLIQDFARSKCKQKELDQVALVQPRQCQ